MSQDVDIEMVLKTFSENQTLLEDAYPGVIFYLIFDTWRKNGRQKNSKRKSHHNRDFLLEKLGKTVPSLRAKLAGTTPFRTHELAKVLMIMFKAWSRDDASLQYMLGKEDELAKYLCEKEGCLVVCHPGDDSLARRYNADFDIIRGPGVERLQTLLP